MSSVISLIRRSNARLPGWALCLLPLLWLAPRPAASSVPAPPIGLVAEPGDRKASLTWFANGEANVSGYRIYHALAENGPYGKAGEAAPGTGYVAGGLANGTTYYFRVTAVTTGGQESAQSYAVAVTPGTAVGRVYAVGPGKPYASLGAVPWNALAPGDMVKIHWRALPYREKILLSSSGSATRPIRVLGVRGPQGQLPVIDGSGATTSPQFAYTWSDFPVYALLMIGRRFGQPYAYTPEHIWIEGLEIRNAYKDYTFTDAAGTRRAYAGNACGIYLYQGRSIVLRGNVITGCGNGVFGLPVGRDILIQGNLIYGNGNVGSDREHNAYTEAVGITYEYNRFGPTRPGSVGSLLKDRSAGTVIRYNTFANGDGTRVLDLVEPQEGGAAIYDDPSQNKTFVYGNVIDYRKGGRIVHYGGDQGIYKAYRKGTLFFYNNTVVARVDRGESWRTQLLYLDTNDESADVRNNIVYFSSATPGAAPTNFSLMATYGRANLGVNWLSPGWKLWSDSAAPAGAVSGTENVLTNGQNEPGFVDPAASDFHLVPSSPGVNNGSAQAPGVPAEHQVLLQYLDPQAVQNRKASGAMDLGAFELEGTAPPRVSSASFTATDAATRGNWKGVYGSTGYNIIGDTSFFPAYVQMRETGHGTWPWAALTGDLRALQKASSSTSRIAARWYTNSFFGPSLTVDLRLTDGQVHRLALYFLDWEGNGKGQRVDVLDGDTDEVLDSRSVAGFAAGKYLVWNVRSHVRIRISPAAAAQYAVLSGIFLD